MSPERFDVTPQELNDAIAVWLATLPKHVTRNLVLQIDKDRRDADPYGKVVEARRALAAALVTKLELAGWAVTRPGRRHPAGGLME